MTTTNDQHLSHAKVAILSSLDDPMRDFDQVCLEWWPKVYQNFNISDIYHPVSLIGCPDEYGLVSRLTTNAVRAAVTMRLICLSSIDLSDNDLIDDVSDNFSGEDDDNDEDELNFQKITIALKKVVDSDTFFYTKNSHHELPLFTLRLFIVYANTKGACINLL